MLQADYSKKKNKTKKKRKEKHKNNPALMNYTSDRQPPINLPPALYKTEELKISKLLLFRFLHPYLARIIKATCASASALI